MTERWSPKKHYKIIASWYHARNLPAPLPDSLPTLGFVVDGRVAGWLRQAEGELLLVDKVISNPITIPSYRQASLRCLAGALSDLSSHLGYERLLVVSSDPDVKALAKGMGAVEATDQVYSVELE